MATTCALHNCPTLVDIGEDRDFNVYCSAEHLAVANTLQLRDVLRQVVEQIDDEELLDLLQQVRGLEAVRGPLPIRRSGSLD